MHLNSIKITAQLDQYYNSIRQNNTSQLDQIVLLDLTNCFSTRRTVHCLTQPAMYLDSTDHSPSQLDQLSISTRPTLHLDSTKQLIKILNEKISNLYKYI